MSSANTGTWRCRPPKPRSTPSLPNLWLDRCSPRHGGHSVSKTRVNALTPAFDGLCLHDESNISGRFISRPTEPPHDRATHHPVLVLLGQERQLLGEVGDALLVGEIR